VVVNPHHAAVADLVTVLGTWWHNLPARFAETELTNLRDLFVVFCQDGGSDFVRGHLKKLHVIFVHFNPKLARSLLMGHLDMTEDRSVEAFDLVLCSCFEVQNVHHSVQLLRGQQLIS